MKERTLPSICFTMLWTFLRSLKVYSFYKTTSISYRMSYLKTIYILLPNCSLRSYLWYICCDLLARSPAMRTNCISVDATLNTPIDAIVVVRFVTSTNCATLTRGERLGRSVEGKAASSQYLGAFLIASQDQIDQENTSSDNLLYIILRVASWVLFIRWSIRLRVLFFLSPQNPLPLRFCDKLLHSATKQNIVCSF